MAAPDHGTTHKVCSNSWTGRCCGLQVVLKPSEETPLTALALAELAGE